MPKKLQWRQPPPPDFCMACRRPNSTRGIMMRGDQEWMTRIFALVTDFEIEVAESVADGIWKLLPDGDMLQGYKAFPLQLCRACARRAVERIVASGLPEPGVYSYARLERDEYQIVKGVDQPQMTRIIDDAIYDLVHSQEDFERYAAEGVTLCRFWNKEEQQWAIYVTDDAEMIAEDEVKVGERLFPPEKPSEEKFRP